MRRYLSEQRRSIMLTAFVDHLEGIQRRKAWRDAGVKHKGNIQSSGVWRKVESYVPAFAVSSDTLVLTGKDKRVSMLF